MVLTSEKINNAWVYYIDGIKVPSEQWQAKFASAKKNIIKKTQVLKHGHAPESVESYVNTWHVGE